MYLRRLDLHGFKSFAQKTSLSFDAGVTCIVGPNGSGKSNLVDAVRWVVGEQRARALRSEKMEHVLFNGTSTRKPLGLAEVSLTLENTRGVLPTEYTEVTLGRRLYRSGESEYLLNGTSCRLRDIQDLFLDTGMGSGAYSVIELSMVEEILSESDDDRRRLFEEAAGVTRYKLRRKQALARLDGMQGDLARLRDLTAELADRVGKLKRQAERAERWKALDDERVRLDQTLAHAEHRRLSDDHDRVAQALADLDRALQADGVALARLDADAERLALARTQAETARNAAHAARQQHLDALTRADADARLAAERRDAMEREEARLVEDVRELVARRAAVERAHERIAEDAAAAAPVVAALRERLVVATSARDSAQQRLAGARAALDARRRDEASAQTALADARRAADRLAARLDLMEAERRRLDEPEAVVAPLPAHSDISVDEARAALDVATDALARAEADRERLAESVRAADAERREADAARRAAEAEATVLDRLVRSYEGADASTLTLAEAGLLGDFVTVIDALVARDPADAAALVAALGAARSWPVVATAADARRAFDRLAETESGRAALVVLDALPEAEAVTTPDGSASLADRVEVASPRYTALRTALLGRTFVAPDLAAAQGLAVRFPGQRFVTRRGEWAEGATVFGGATDDAPPPPSRLVQHERLAELRAAAEALAADVQAAAAREAESRRALAALDLAPFRADRVVAEAALRRAEAAAARAAAEAESAARAAEARQARRAALEADLAALRADVPEAAAAVQAADSRRVDAAAAVEQAAAAVRVAESDGEGAFAVFNDLRVDETAAALRLAQHEAERDRTARTLADLDRQADERRARRARLAADAEAADAAHAEAASSRDALLAGRVRHDRAADDADTALNEAASAVSAHDLALRETRRVRDARADSRTDAARREADLAARLDGLRSAYAEAHHLPLEPGAVAVPEGFDPAEARTMLDEVRRKIASLGAVNALALDEYASERARLDVLEEQQADLETAEATLLATIREINQTAAARFAETFDEIRASFQTLFVELFGEGAAADVALVRPNEPLESPIAITARPSGKRPSVLTQLSGGEKTLTAIALLFAIYLVKPSPFCILDEVDAPLDEANVDRYMRLIRRFSERTQFLLVTHNKRTMELADRLYGVTMQEPGVTTLVSVTFQDAADLVD